MTFYTRKNQYLTHYSLYVLEEGQIINKTLIPDTIFGQHGLVSEIGLQIRLLDGYYTNEEKQDNRQTIATGKIIESFGGGKSCHIYSLVELDQTYKGFSFLQINYLINAYTNVYGLSSDSLILKPVECFEPSYWPVEEPVFLEEGIYIEYF